MKILHIWDCAGVASILAKWQEKQGHTVKVLMRKTSDKLGISQFYGNTIDLTGKPFLDLAFKEAKNYDVIHVHNISKIIPKLKLRYPGKKIILHFHGFTSATQKRAKICAFFADRVFLATEDLKSVFPKGHVIPTPIDTDHFKGMSESDKKLSFHIRYLDLEKFKDATNDDSIEIIDREKKHIPYGVMPSFLKKYGTYYDIKYMYGNLLHAQSKTCYEALACGLDVINWQGKRLTGLPPNHRPEIVANLCTKLYF